MSMDHAPMRELSAPDLRLLLTLSRELFQTDDAGSSLVLIGQALASLLRPASALLLLRGERLELAAFDAHGALQPAGPGHPMAAAGMAQLAAVDAAAHGDDPGGGQFRRLGPRAIALALPLQSAVAALVADWEHELAPGVPEAHEARMALLLELTAAALGKIDARSSLERLVGDQRQHIVHTSSAHAAELAQRDQMASEMHLLSLTDVLTGLYNRRGFFVEAERIFKVARRQRTRSAVLFADIDGLKRVNDALGHDAGDSLIRDAAFVFRQSFRQADVVSRLGGDEFVAYTLDDEHPGVILDRICTNLHAFNLMHDRPYAVSVSAGLVQCDPLGTQTLADYVLQADEQMYSHKRSGLH